MAVQLNVVKGIFEVKVTAFEDVPAQISWERFVLVTEGIGFTVITTFFGVPGQFVGAGPIGVIT